MKKKLNRYGFSMAELLMVVAILVALFGVAFVAVQNHQRSMTQLEYDTIAKEIFVAAQNHLTAAESQGYLGHIANEGGYGTKSSYTGTSENDPKDEVYYFTVTKGKVDQGKMLDLMLPFGAIDETIRAGGSYIIRYQPSSARVLDVFYSNPGQVTAWLTISGAPLDGTDTYSNLMENFRGDDKKADRRKCSVIGGAVVGWYGDGDALPVGDRLKAPQVLIHNEETLWVEVKDTNTPGTDGSGTSLVLIVTGETSEAKKVFYLRNGTNVTNGNRITELSVVLDDITQPGFHFAEIKAESSTPPFIPGENIIVEAVAYNNNALTNVAYSGKGRTNSIFADPSSYVPKQTSTSTGTQVKKTDDLAINGTIVDETSGTAAVTNFRHLENLDRIISNWGKDLDEVNTKEIKFTSAIQLTNLSDSDSDKLSWTSFVEKTHGSIISLKKGQTDSENYMPVYLENGFDYFGRNHIVGDVKSNGILTGDAQRNVAGVFGELNGGSVSDILVMDAEITGSGNAGGLIGSMSGTTVERCAANGTVSSSATAGGLIGSASGGSVTACYSAGHTKDGSYQDWVDEDGHTYDVTGATAGGLIGSSTAAVRNSYSTCSVSGTTAAGGFVGNASGGSIENCYAVGLVATKAVETKDDHSMNSNIGSFAGVLENITSLTGKYFGIINEVKREETKDGKTVEMFDHYLGAVGDVKETIAGISEIDLNVGSYEAFVGAPDDWTKAEPNDDALKTYYQETYNLKGISRLAGTSGTPTGGTTDPKEPIVYTHYGDWPAPEIFVINTPGQAGTGESGGGTGGA